MKRLFHATALVAFLILSVSGLAWSQEEPAPGSSVEVSAAEDGILTADGRRMYFVELTGASVADDGVLADILTAQANVRGAAAQAGVRYTERKAYQVLFNGFAVDIDARDIGKMRRIPGVAALHPIVTFTVPDEPEVNEPELLTALSMTGADIAQSGLGLTGAGVKVGVIDTGQDYDHQDLGGDGVHRVNSSMFPNARSITGYDFVGDAFVPGGTPVPDDFPDDCNGHGTHVSGIIGASGGITGVAPGVKFGVYKVFGCGNTTSADVMIEAMERAYSDGMQVINMSIGAAFQWPSYPTAAAATKLVNKGVVMVCSAGNEGTTGLYASSAPSVGKKVIGVASYDNIFVHSSAFTASPDNVVIAYSPGIDAPSTPLSGTFPLARTGTQASTADACAALPPGSLTGKVALIRRGTCSFYQKVTNAQNAGAIAVIIYNNVAGGITPVVTGTPPVQIPVVGITAAAGVLLDNRLAGGPVDITWTTGSSTPNAAGGFISGFSSHGQTYELTLKPDIGAPGGLIRSTVPLNQGTYANNSGTSMSSPHVAGGVALLLQALPNTPSNAVRDILQNSANPKSRSATIPNLDLVHRQGAGMLDIPGAVQATTRIVPGKLSLGETSGGSVVGSFTISNNSDHAISYDLSDAPALASGPNTFAISLFNAPSTVSFSADPVVVPAGGSASVDVTVTPNAGLADKSLFGGYVVVIPDDGGAEYRVPYGGFKGDYQSIQVLTPTPNGFPWLAKQIGTSLVNQPGGASYTMAGVDVPNIVVHLDHGVAKLRWEIFDAVTGETRHRALDVRDFRRSTSATSFFALIWNGTTFHGNHAPEALPNGTYTLQMSVLKALGDDNNPAHWETWTSPPITIARPDIQVANLWVSQNSVVEGDQVTVAVQVRNNSANAHNGVHVEFLDQDVLIGEATIDLPGNGEQLIESPWTVGAGESHRLRARVSPVELEENFENNEVALDITPGQPIVGVDNQKPKVLSLSPAKPNPFNGQVSFRFALPESGPVRLDVFDLAGRRLKSWSWGNLAAGEHSIEWNGRTDAGRHAPAGTVLLRLSAMGRTLNQKAVRLP